MSSAYHDGSVRLPPYTPQERREIKGAIVARFRANLAGIGAETGTEAARLFIVPVALYPELADELRVKLAEKGRADIWQSFREYRQQAADEENRVLRDAAEWLRRNEVRKDWKPTKTPEQMTDAELIQSLKEKLQKRSAAAS